MTWKRLLKEAEEFRELTGLDYYIKAQNGAVAVVAPCLGGGYNLVTHWVATHQELAEWMDAFRRGFHAPDPKHKRQAT